jgi:hypothetical protein
MYMTPVLTCGCGEAFPLDVREFVHFLKTCTKCGSEFSIKTKIPKEILVDPSRTGTLTNVQAK